MSAPSPLSPPIGSPKPPAVNVVQPLSASSSSPVSLDLSVLGTITTRKAPLLVSPEEKRYRSMRRGVLFTARAVEESIARSGRQFKKGFVTLTYRPGVAWAPEHISQTMACYTEWARRRATLFRYVWVMELTKAGVPHYHVLFWVPIRSWWPPMPDARGWWKHGLCQSMPVRSPIGYMVKYLSKGLSGPAFPPGARIWGSGGLTPRQRLRRRWYYAPEWLKRFAPPGTVCRVRRCDGGWWNMTTGWWYRSPWWVTGFDRYGPVLQWVGWQPDDIELRGALC